MYEAKSQQVDGIGTYFGEAAETNNQTKAAALEAAVTFLEDNDTCYKGKNGIVIRGDSRLIIDFMTGMAKPGTAYLQKKIRGLQKRIRNLKIQVYWQYVVRERNQVADWLAQQARKNMGVVSLTTMRVITRPFDNADTLKHIML